MICDDELLKLQQTLYTSKNPTRRWLHCSRRDWILNAINRYQSKKNAKALEIGPGSGLYLPVLSTLFQQVTAIDVEDAFLRNADDLTKKHANLRLLADDITDSRLPTATFDLILCTEVVEHLTNSDAAISEIHRLLKPSGILILTTPQRFSSLELISRIAFLPGFISLVRLIYGESILETGHINLMTHYQMLRKLEASKFYLLEHYKSGLYLPLVAEFLGLYGMKIEQWLETRIRTVRFFRDLLWTQYIVAEALK